MLYWKWTDSIWCLDFFIWQMEKFQVPDMLFVICKNTWGETSKSHIMKKTSFTWLGSPWVDPGVNPGVDVACS